jgi:hypothetical protein
MSNHCGILGSQDTKFKNLGILRRGGGKFSLFQFRDTMLAGGKFQAPFVVPKSSSSRPVAKK